MNKKQLIVAWVMGIIICIIVTSNRWMVGTLSYRFSFASIFFDTLPVLIIGGLLIYTLRDNKK